MGRDLSCASGLPAYRTKRDAAVAHPDAAIARCERCRWWHPKVRRRRGGGARNR